MNAEELIARVDQLPDTPEGNAEARQLLREYSVKQKSVVHRPLPLSKEVVLDGIKDIDQTPKRRLVYPVREGEARVERQVHCKLMPGGGMVIADDLTVPVGSVLWMDGKPYQILRTEPIWDATYKKCYYCECQEVLD